MKNTSVQTWRTTSLAIITFTLLLITYSSFSQYGTIEWEKTYGMAGGDAARDIIQTDDGGYIFTGLIEDSLNDNSYSNLWVMKIDANGDSAWSSSYEIGGFQSEGKSISQTSDGGYIVVGKNRETNMLSTSMLVLKITADGTKEWHKIFGSDYFQDEGAKVIETDDKSYVICGYTMTYAAGNSDAWILKIDSLGSEIWNTSLGGSEWDYFSDVIQTDDGSFVAVGYKNGFTNARMWVVKINTEGTKIWEKEHGQGGMNIAYSVLQNSDKSYIVSGKSQIANGEPFDFMILKLDELGDTIWTKVYGHNTNNIPYSMQPVSGGGYIIAGDAWHVGAGDVDMWVLRIGADGDSLWSKTYGDAYYDDAFKILQIADCGYVMAGLKGMGSGNVDAYVIKIAPDIGAGIYGRSLDNVVSLNNYPNPFKNETTISFEINKNEHIKLTVTDMHGRQIRVLADEGMKAGNYQLNYSTANLQNGVYFINLQTENALHIKRIIKTN